MARRPSREAFTGPFDLLLTLVASQRVAIGAISVSDLADQYLAELEAAGDVDLEVASDFFAVAAQLLRLKAASLLPDEPAPADEGDEDEWDGPRDPEGVRDLLVERLVAYRQFRDAAAALGRRQEAEESMLARVAGPDPEFADLMPDFLSGVTLRGLAVIAADLAGRRQAFLLEADHVAPPRAPVALTTRAVDRFTQAHPRTTFAELVGSDASAEDVVVTLLAVLELHKLGSVGLAQREPFAEIAIDRAPDARPYKAETSLWEEVGA